ncbi:hypothetical protein G293_02260 [Candidatus Liberibacter africanus PTSAPSY]|uniref:Uncharacterized protein n=1 Tax=Candidatus Liberibacter africanus PTSAPSY TaxID=1277257 RepID=A0A0G3I2H9_LIBAF|nr:hypothetical protein G293_02260 [Candidatus Liberibacter africanus PTSAPSY]
MLLLNVDNSDLLTNNTLKANRHSQEMTMSENKESHEKLMGKKCIGRDMLRHTLHTLWSVRSEIRAGVFYLVCT